MKDIAGASSQLSNIFNKCLLFGTPKGLKFGTDAQIDPVPGIVLILDVGARIGEVI